MKGGSATSQSGSAHKLVVERINVSLSRTGTPAERRALLRTLALGEPPTSDTKQDVRDFGQPGIGLTSYYRETATPASTFIVFLISVCEENRRSQFLDEALGSLGGDLVFFGNGTSAIRGAPRRPWGTP